MPPAECVVTRSSGRSQVGQGTLQVKQGKDCTRSRHCLLAVWLAGSMPSARPSRMLAAKAGCSHWHRSPTMCTKGKQNQGAAQPTPTPTPPVSCLRSSAGSPQNPWTPAGHVRVLPWDTTDSPASQQQQLSGATIGHSSNKTLPDVSTPLGLLTTGRPQAGGGWGGGVMGCGCCTQSKHWRTSSRQAVGAVVGVVDHVASHGDGHHAVAMCGRRAKGQHRQQGSNKPHFRPPEHPPPCAHRSKERL